MYIFACHLYIDVSHSGQIPKGTCPGMYMGTHITVVSCGAVVIYIRICVAYIYIQYERLQAYIGQTGGSLHQRIAEHRWALRNGDVVASALHGRACVYHWAQNVGFHAKTHIRLVLSKNFCSFRMIYAKSTPLARHISIPTSLVRNLKR